MWSRLHRLELAERWLELPQRHLKWSPLVGVDIRAVVAGVTLDTLPPGVLLGFGVGVRPGDYSTGR